MGNLFTKLQCFNITQVKINTHIYKDRLEKIWVWKKNATISFLAETVHVFFYKKLGSAPSTKSFLISHENFAIIVLKVS